MAAEVDDAIDAGDDLGHSGRIGEIGGDEGLVGREIGGLAQVAPDELRIDPL